MENEARFFSDSQRSQTCSGSTIVADEPDTRTFESNEPASSSQGSEKQEGNPGGSSDVWKPNVPDKLDCYPMKEVGASVRGWVLVFYHEDFDVNLDLPRRDGVENDVENLRRVFRDRGFLVKAYKDLKFEIIKGVLNETARSQDLKDHDCLIVCFLSHGQDGGHLFANNVRFDEEELWRPFYGDKCKALVDKPKLFFIQACRGEVLDEGVKAMVRRAGHSRGDTHDSHQRHEEEYHLPTHANILIAHATYEGHVAWKSSHLGSYFIYTLCEVFEKHSETLDLIKMLTIVAQIIAFEFKSSNRDAVWDNKKQMPTIRSTLTRELYLTPKANH